STPSAPIGALAAIAKPSWPTSCSRLNWRDVSMGGDGELLPPRARGNRIQPQQRPADGLGDDDPQAGVTQPREGRRNPCVACHLPRRCECERGILFDQKQRPPSPEAQDRETAGWLWEISERQCAVSGRSAEARS